MIITHITSGLGNQLFQYAAGYGLAKTHKTQLRLDTRFYLTNPLRPYELDRLCISAKTIGVSDKIRINISATLPQKGLLRQSLRLLPLRRLRVFVDGVAGVDQAVLNAPDYSYLRGYWQNEGYFAHCREDILRELSFRHAPDAENAAMISQIRQQPSVCVHVRRGDYLSPKEILSPAPLQYYTDALAWMRQRVPGGKLFVFSDDPDWTRANLPMPDAVYVTHNAGKNDPEDLRLMACCNHFIIANSTFSWWGAWLSPSPGKLVVAPRQWFSKPNGNEQHIVPGEWIRL